MFAYPVSASSSIIGKGVTTQLAMYASLSQRLLNTSRQVSELNQQASLRLIEETATDMRRALHIRSISDAQMFLQEQSRLQLEKMSGYLQNLQYIASSNWLAPLDAGAATASSETTAQEASDEDEEDSVPRHHEEDVKASPLVEKLISVAVADNNRPEGRSA